MLLKYTNSDRKILISSKGNGGGGGSSRGTAMRMTVATSSTMTPRIHRKGFRTPSKRHPGKVLPGKLHSISRISPGKIGPGKRINPRPHPPPCDNSNDSGFGFDQHLEIQNNNNNNTQHDQVSHHQHQPQQILRQMPQSRCGAQLLHNNNEVDDDDSDDDDCVVSIQPRTKYRKIEIDNDDACSNDAFIEKIASSATITAAAAGVRATTVTPTIMPSAVTNLTPSVNANASYATTVTKFLSNPTRGNVRAALKKPTMPVQSSITSSSKNSSIQLQIISQPEQQHRARYQTEGSRGAVKDRSGNGFPIVKLIGYNKPAVLQVFIGTDIGRIAPHMFYQACKVAGKNSTPCNEKKIDGTMIIEIDFKPENDMTITCDCVGILKERNVDVEHRFPDHSGQRSKKKSTRCRMIFRTQLTHDDGTLETLQVCSYPIICTQPPGVPEICKKSLNSCPVDGGLELYIVGKNFLKDTCVVFRENDNDMSLMQNPSAIWEQTVLPDKEYLQQTHLICTVPPYIHQNIVEPVSVQVFVMSSGKRSESHTFVYRPKGVHTILSASTTLGTATALQHHSALTNHNKDACFVDNTAPNGTSATGQTVLWSAPNVLEPKHEIDSDMMPPPTALPLGVSRRPSTSSNSNAIAIAAVAAAAAAAPATATPADVVAAAAEQISSLAALKTEIMDENSQSSIPDTMQTDSLDQFPPTSAAAAAAVAAVAAANATGNSPTADDAVAAAAAVVAAAAAAASSPMQRFRKQNMDIDLHSMSAMLNENSNSMSSFPTRNVVDMRTAVKQEQLESQLQSQILSTVAAAAAAVQASQTTQVAQNQEMNKFLSNLESSISELKTGQIDPTTGNSLFVGPSATNSPNGLFSQTPQPMNAMSLLPTATAPTLEQTFTQNLLSSNSPPTTSNMNQILSSISHQNDSPKMVCSPASTSSSSSSSGANIHSPVTQDIILNSEPAASIQSANIHMMQQQQQQSIVNNNTPPCAPQHMSSEMILNPTVSPTMICDPTAPDPNGLIVNQVTMANTILNEINMAAAAAASHNSQDSILNNMMMNHSSPTSSQLVDNSVHKSATNTSNAMDNMILKVAADFITNQERGSMSTESTLNALMSLNSSSMLTDSQILNSIPSNSQQNVTATPVTSSMLNCNDPTTLQQTATLSQQQQQQQQQQTRLSDIISAGASVQQQQQQQQTAISRQLSQHFNEQNLMQGQLNTGNSVPLENLLINQNMTRAAAAAVVAQQNHQFLQNLNNSLQKTSNVTPSTTQESLLQSVSLSQSDLEKVKIVAEANEQPTTTASTQSASTVTAIPQEITNMSESDLLSYINPSCFDQV